MLKRIAGVILMAALAGACARPYAPPGGDPDRLPPALVTTSPAPLSVLTELDAPVVFRFDERLRTRNFSRSLVSVNPGAPEDVEFDVGGAEIRVRRRGGWLAGQIYHVIIRPGVEDLFNNRRTQAAELVFSTGPEVPANALAGLIEDRLTGRAARDAVVEAVRRSDSTIYRAYGDSSAFFALRHVPYGTYDLDAFSDGNRNGRRDPAEPRHLGVTTTIGPGRDTVQVFFVLLPADTTPPRLLRADLDDSTHIRLTFDDAIDVDSGLVAAAAELYALPDSTLVPAVLALQLQAAATAAAAAARSLAAAGDTAAAAPERARPPIPAPPAQADPTRAVPEKVVVVSSDRALAPGDYAVLVRTARNVNGLAGGGSARFTVRPPTPPTQPATDTVPEARTGRL